MLIADRKEVFILKNSYITVNLTREFILLHLNTQVFSNHLLNYNRK